VLIYYKEHYGEMSLINIGIK